MAYQTITALKALLETGDILLESTCIDLVDSTLFSDQTKTATANDVAADWGEFTSITTAAASDTVTLAASSSVGQRLEVHNASGNQLVLAKDAGDSYRGSPSTVIPDGRAFSARVVAANTIVVIGTGV